MSRTTRKLPGHFHKKTPCWGEDPEWYAEWELQHIRGKWAAGYVHTMPTKSGGYRWFDTTSGVNSKRWYKRVVARMRRREAKVKLRRW